VLPDAETLQEIEAHIECQGTTHQQAINGLVVLIAPRTFGWMWNPLLACRLDDQHFFPFWSTSHKENKIYPAKF
jgi:hypothetical protein